MPPLFAWQAWHLATSTVTLRGRMALGDIDRHFAWQAWHLWHWAAAVCVAGVALGDIDRHSAWQV